MDIQLIYIYIYIYVYLILSDKLKMVHGINWYQNISFF